MKKVYLALLFLVSSLFFWGIIDHYQVTSAKNNQLRTEIKMLENPPLASAPPRPLILPPDPRQGIPMPPPPQKIEKDIPVQQIDIELIGVLKLQINDGILWETIAKILVLMLVSYGGVKYINKRFA